MKPGVSLNGFEARTDHAHYFVLAGANQVLQRPSHLPLVIGDQHAHISRCRNFHANRADKLSGARGSRDISSAYVPMTLRGGHVLNFPLLSALKLGRCRTPSLLPSQRCLLAAYVPRSRDYGMPGRIAALYLGSSRCARPLNTPPRSRAQPSGHVAHPTRSIHQDYGEPRRSEVSTKRRRRSSAKIFSAVRRARSPES